MREKPGDSNASRHPVSLPAPLLGQPGNLRGWLLQVPAFTPPASQISQHPELCHTPSHPTRSTAHVLMSLSSGHKTEYSQTLSGPFEPWTDSKGTDQSSRPQGPFLPLPFLTAQTSACQWQFLEHGALEHVVPWPSASFSSLLVPGTHYSPLKTQQWRLFPLKPFLPLQCPPAHNCHHPWGVSLFIWLMPTQL